ncbi:MAG: DUF2784 family protein [Propionibacteriales bacterium]|nr:DUF2784 family protein [Propionibacteriales bacterium]
MIYRWLADGVFLLHASFLIFLVVGGFLAWRWRWLIWPHLVVFGWSVAIVVIDFPCPFTGWEKSMLRRGGEEVYDGGYIQHYLDGTIWPEGSSLQVEIAAFSLVVVSYLGLGVRWLRRRRMHAAA